MRTLKIAVIVCAMMFVSYGSAMASGISSGGIKWNGYKEGMALARENGKKIYINFHASWCGYCVKMEKTTFKDDTVIRYLNTNFIPIRVDADKEKKVANDYGVRGLPANWFVENSGKRIGNQPGYLDAKQLLKLLKFVSSGEYNK